MLSDLKCSEFIEVLSSSEPVPGGGSTAAFVGAIGTALANMVGSLTTGKKKYADVEEEICALMEKCTALRGDFLILMEEDANAFRSLTKAYRMPTGTEEERREKDRVMDIELEKAAQPPLAIMEKAAEVIELCDVFAEKGSRLAVSDAGVGVILCKSALQGAALNVFINTKMMKDREIAEALNQQADALLLNATVRADEVYGKVYQQVRG